MTEPSNPTQYDIGMANRSMDTAQAQAQLRAHLVPAAATRPLRRTVLLAGHPPELSVFPGDEDEDTFHVGVTRSSVDGSTALIAIASMFLEPGPACSTSGPASGEWRLRGMASDPQHRGIGAGMVALDACLQQVRERGAWRAWCNARTPAVGFYERAGWTVRSDVFDIPVAGPHVVMDRLLARGNGGS